MHRRILWYWKHGIQIRNTKSDSEIGIVKRNKRRSENRGRDRQRSGEMKGRVNLVLRIELLFELRDFTLLCGWEVLGIVPTHPCAPFLLLLLLLPHLFTVSLTLLDSNVNGEIGDGEEKIAFGWELWLTARDPLKRRRRFNCSQFIIVGLLFPPL